MTPRRASTAPRRPLAAIAAWFGITPAPRRAMPTEPDRETRTYAEKAWASAIRESSR